MRTRRRHTVMTLVAAVLAIVVIGAVALLSLRRALPRTLSGTYGLSALQVAERLRSQGMPIDRIQPNPSVSQKRAVTFSDRRLNAHQRSGGLSITDGGAVEELPSNTDAAKRVSDLQNATPAPDEHDYAVAGIVLRLSPGLSAEQAEAYQLTLRTILNKAASAHHS